MPRTRRDRSVSFEGCRKSPAPCSPSLTCDIKAKSPLASEEDLIEWEDARCVVCMEHPHNAVLLVCSAYDKGCRPYMCDTSYQLSNCFDLFRKSCAEGTTAILSEGAEQQVQASEFVTVETVVTSQEEGEYQGPSATDIDSMHKLPEKLVCPLCRGKISGWVVLYPAHNFINAKTRTCALETCEFSGNYSDLRKHARLEHPHVKPSEADPERQQSWRQLERQRDIGDVLSTIQSSLVEELELPLAERSITILYLSWLQDLNFDYDRASASVEDEDSTDVGLAFRHYTRRRRLSTSADSSEGALALRRYVRRRLSTPDDYARSHLSIPNDSSNSGLALRRYVRRRLSTRDDNVRSHLSIPNDSSNSGLALRCYVRRRISTLDDNVRSHLSIPNDSSNSGLALRRYVRRRLSTPNDSSNGGFALRCYVRRHLATPDESSTDGLGLRRYVIRRRYVRRLISTPDESSNGGLPLRPYLRRRLVTTLDDSSNGGLTLRYYARRRRLSTPEDDV
ncbi:uncharacterized protein LOC130824290 [Amaranthus tricolor]|uniref:uncharacterized protein LOC130824290 n=1 Tax=Amaranthus tricolor TaxID=29722 RepID=UPI00258B69A0|nr:uncharacterized protein LOC130824290 [Amaranthus tricolor]